MAAVSSPPGSKRKRAPRLDPEVRRPLLLDAALKVYLRLGYDGASMDAIADEAQVTKPVLYNSFGGKRELFEALLEREQLEIMTVLLASLPEDVESEHPERALLHGFRAYLRAVAARPDSYRATLLAEQGSDPVVSARVADGRRLMAGQIGAMVEQWLRTVDAPDAARVATVAGHAIVGMGEAFGRMLLDEPDRWRPDELADVAATLLTDGARGLAG